MNFSQIVKSSTYYLETYVTDSNGDGKAGLSVTYAVYKSSDNSFVTSGTMVDIGGGIYQNSIVIGTLGQYRVIYTTPTSYENGVETLMVVNQPAEQVTLDLYGDMIKRILGLSQENYRIFDPEFDRNHNLIGGTIRIYASAVDCENDTNPLAEYDMDARYILKNNRVTYYKMKRTA